MVVGKIISADHLNFAKNTKLYRLFTNLSHFLSGYCSVGAYMEPSSSKTDSNYYFFKSTPAEQAAQFRPKAIENEVVEPTKPVNGASAWNKAGTWEELDITKWANTQMETMFVGIKPADGTNVSITEADDVEGHATLVWSRGQKKVTYEYDVTLKWEGEIDGTTATGTIQLQEMDFTNLDDFDIKYKADKADDLHIKLRNAMKTCEKQIRAKMQQFVKDAVLQE